MLDSIQFSEIVGINPLANASSQRRPDNSDNRHLTIHFVSFDSFTRNFGNEKSSFLCFITDGAPLLRCTDAVFKDEYY